MFFVILYSGIALRNMLALVVICAGIRDIRKTLAPTQATVLN